MHCTKSQDVVKPFPWITEKFIERCGYEQEMYLLSAVYSKKDITSVSFHGRCDAIWTTIRIEVAGVSK